MITGDLMLCSTPEDMISFFGVILEVNFGGCFGSAFTPRAESGAAAFLVGVVLDFAELGLTG